ncbi:DUF397 domain-containing protein [Streptomyces sp. NBC_00487]|uniref:DUF397 domain-containing protein n=1 Tax=unclassified Streptomyces TaxID=2593676 RepID=UPI002E17462C|nr:MULTISPECIES: DUF397 domain-containing protein [unclassified Streptomyces]
MREQVLSKSQWSKSSFSGEGGNNCVEIAAPSPEGIALRESESPIRVLTTDRAVFGALVQSAKARHGS